MLLLLFGAAVYRGAGGVERRRWHTNRTAAHSWAEEATVAAERQTERERERVKEREGEKEGEREVRALTPGTAGDRAAWMEYRTERRDYHSRAGDGSSRTRHGANASPPPPRRRRRHRVETLRNCFFFPFLLNDPPTISTTVSGFPLQTFRRHDRCASATLATLSWGNFRGTFWVAQSMF